MCFRIIVYLIFCFYSVNAMGQDTLYTCGNQFLKSKINDKYPATSNIFRNKLASRYINASRSAWQGNAKNTMSSPIPVIFHIVLNQAQLNRINGVEGIKERIDSQIAVINRDYNGLNTDTASIPGPFKSLYANVGIKFALAHTNPEGGSTPGYDIKLTDSAGFGLYNGFGSGFGFSSAKYSVSGGADSWDPESYINVWVINMPSAFVGVTVPKSYTGDTYNIPLNENGVVLSYGSLGFQTDQSQYYLYGKNMGRTLTHELGHMFELEHTWGDDDGKCPWDGGEDDGIADTPPQSNPTYGCPGFPQFDKCSSSDNGIMFVNYMDYASDSCKLMFTLEQADMMRFMISFSQESYSLTQHPQLLLWPDNSNPQNLYSIYPNPTNATVAITFDKVSQDLRSIKVVNTLGQVIRQINTDVQSGFYSFDLNDYPSGIYFAQLIFSNKIEVNKILKLAH